MGLRKSSRWLVGAAAVLLATTALAALALEIWPLLPYHTLDFITSRLAKHAHIRPSPYFGLLHAVAQGAGHEERGRQAIDCAKIPHNPRTAVILIFGQSNAANHGERPFTPEGQVYNLNFYTGRCFVARDPLLGATASGGSLGAPLADQLLKDGLFDAVLLVPIAVGGSAIEDWAPGGQHHRRLMTALDRTRDAGFAPTFLIWHQGESNTRWNANADVYQAYFHDMLAAIRARAIDAPIFVPLASICYAPADKVTRQGQAALPDPKRGIYPGPDTDTLGDGLRFDGCHFSERGLALHAQLWAMTLRRHLDRGSGHSFPRVTAATIGAGPAEPELFLSEQATPGRARAWRIEPLRVTSILPLSSARPQDGVGLFGVTFTPARAGARVIVRVRLSATATARNDLAVAVFRSDEQTPIAVYQTEIEPGRGTELDREIDAICPSSGSINFVTRIGLARSGGEAVLNFDSPTQNNSAHISVFDVQQVD